MRQIKGADIRAWLLGHSPDVPFDGGGLLSIERRGGRGRGGGRSDSIHVEKGNTEQRAGGAEWS